MTQKIAYQGYPGAYSQMACLAAHPEMEPVQFATFELALEALHEGLTDLSMVPIENSVAGRVADLHSLLPSSNLHIVGEHYQRVEHCLLAPKGAKLSDIKFVHSHLQGLSQCRKFFKKHGLERKPEANTAMAAQKIAEMNDPTHAAIASRLAAEIYGLEILSANIEDADHNTTRFLIMAKEPKIPPLGNEVAVTTFVFRVKNIPAALYKSLGGFATNGINMTKLESYLVDGDFIAAQFYADVEAHPDEKRLQLALEELHFFSNEVKILGTYPAHPYRFHLRS